MHFSCKLQQKLKAKIEEKKPRACNLSDESNIYLHHWWIFDGDIKSEMGLAPVVFDSPAPRFSPMNIL